MGSPQRLPLRPRKMLVRPTAVAHNSLGFPPTQPLPLRTIWGSAVSRSRGRSGSRASAPSPERSLSELRPETGRWGSDGERNWCHERRCLRGDRFRGPRTRLLKSARDAQLGLLAKFGARRINRVTLSAHSGTSIHTTRTPEFGPFPAARLDRPREERWVSLPGGVRSSSRSLQDVKSIMRIVLGRPVTCSTGISPEKGR